MKDASVVPFRQRTVSTPKPLNTAAEREAADLVEVFRAVCIGDRLEDVFAKWLRRIPTDPGQEHPAPAELVRRVGKTVIFETPERSRYVAALFFAALHARKWGDFRSWIPKDEWEHLVEKLEVIPDPDEPFDATVVPGFGNGNWPPTTDKEKKAVVMAFLNALPVTPGRGR